jgi:hypothetical protein
MVDLMSLDPSTPIEREAGERLLKPRAASEPAPFKTAKPPIMQDRRLCLHHRTGKAGCALVAPYVVVRKARPASPTGEA